MTGLEVGYLNLTPEDIHLRAAPIYRDPKLGALHDRGKIWGFDFEMLDVLLLDFEKDRAGLLADRSRELTVVSRNSDCGIGRDKDPLFTTHQKNTTITTSSDIVAGRQVGFGPKGDLLSRAMTHPDFAS